MTLPPMSGCLASGDNREGFRLLARYTDPYLGGAYVKKGALACGSAADPTHLALADVDWDSLRQPDGRLELCITWPGEGLYPVQWRQRAAPTDKVPAEGCAIDGFELVSTRPASSRGTDHYRGFDGLCHGGHWRLERMKAVLSSPSGYYWVGATGATTKVTWRSRTVGWSDRTIGSGFPGPAQISGGLVDDAGHVAPHRVELHVALPCATGAPPRPPSLPATVSPPPGWRLLARHVDTTRGGGFFDRGLADTFVETHDGGQDTERRVEHAESHGGLLQLDFAVAWDEYRMPDGLLEMRIVWPGSGLFDGVWRQRSPPTEYDRVDGFLPVMLPDAWFDHEGNATFSGICRSQSREYALFDGRPGHSNFHWAVGTFDGHGGEERLEPDAIPGSTAVWDRNPHHVELWIRQPALLRFGDQQLRDPGLLLSDAGIGSEALVDLGAADEPADGRWPDPEQDPAYVVFVNCTGHDAPLVIGVSADATVDRLSRLAHSRLRRGADD